MAGTNDIVPYPTKASEIEPLLSFIDVLKNTEAWSISVDLNFVNTKDKYISDRDTLLNRLAAFDPVVAGENTNVDVTKGNTTFYCDTMRECKGNIQMFITQLTAGEFPATANSVKNAFENLFGFILGLFDLPKPRQWKKLKYNNSLFLKNSVKTNLAKQISKEAAMNESLNRTEREEYMRNRTDEQIKRDNYRKSIWSNKHKTLWEELLGFVLGLFYIELNTTDTKKKKKYKNISLEHYVGIFRDDLDIWTKQLQGVPYEETNVPQQVEHDRARDSDDYVTEPTVVHEHEWDDEDDVSAPEENNSAESSPVAALQKATDDKNASITFLNSFRGVQEWTELQVVEKGLDVQDKLKAVDFGALPEVITRYNNVMQRNRLKPDARIYETHQRKLEKLEHILYPLTLVFAEPDDRTYYKLMRENQEQIVNVIDSLSKDNVTATKDMLHPLFAWILGSFDYPVPDTSLNGFNAALFRESQLKKFVAHGQTSSEHFAFLKDLLGYTLALQARVSARVGESRSTEFGKFDEIIQMWLLNIENKGNATQQEAGPNWESSTEEKSEIDNRKNLEDIAEEQISVQERHTKYRTKMADMITLVNIRWQHYAVDAPNKWVVHVEDYVEIVSEQMELARQTHDFGVIEEARENAKEEEWTDILPNTVMLDGIGFFQSVHVTLTESIAKADFAKKTKKGNEGVWFIKAHQRAFGYALICVKRLYMQWCINATYVKKFHEQRRDRQSRLDYENYFLQIICALTIVYRLVACCRAVQNMVAHELDYDDSNKKEEDKLANNSVTRWDLETAKLVPITWQNVTTNGPKYFLRNPRNNTTYNKLYIVKMLGICGSVHQQLSWNWTLPSADLHLCATRAVKDAEWHLNNLRLCPLGVETVIKQYQSFKWDNHDKKKTLQTVSWKDYMPTNKLSGQYFFHVLFQDFTEVQTKHLNGTFRNDLFPGHPCYSRQYKKRMQYIKVLVKRVLYMAMFNQIDIGIHETRVIEFIQQLYLHIELVRAIHSIQESENRSLKYMKVPWISGIVKELEIQSTPAKPPLVGRFGK